MALIPRKEFECFPKNSFDPGRISDRNCRTTSNCQVGPSAWKKYYTRAIFLSEKNMIFCHCDLLSKMNRSNPNRRSVKWRFPVTVIGELFVRLVKRRVPVTVTTFNSVL
jgi:hypothetical protein